MKLKMSEVQRFEEYVSENFTDDIFYTQGTQKKFVQAAMYDLAKRTGLHLDYFMSDRKQVQINVPHKNGGAGNSNSAYELKRILDHLEIDYLDPASNRGSGQFLKVNAQQLSNYGRDIYPHTDSIR